MFCEWIFSISLLNLQEFISIFLKLLVIIILIALAQIIFLNGEATQYVATIIAESKNCTETVNTQPEEKEEVSSSG